MRTLSCLILSLFFGVMSRAQSMQGAWKQEQSGIHTIFLLMDGYATVSTYTDSSFIATWGGPFSADQNQLAITKEFDTEKPQEIGTVIRFGFSFPNPDSMVIRTTNGAISYRLKNLDHATAPLSGVWKITGRMEDGKINQIHQTGPRKTLKMLTGTRFQWFAINPESKEFFGTGGGSYTFENGKYTEHILFFSRDNTRVGSDLQFDGKIENKQWHHSGLSSRGEKIYEIWSRGK